LPISIVEFVDKHLNGNVFMKSPNMSQTSVRVDNFEDVHSGVLLLFQA
jgi:hypothetical protein